MAKIAIIRTGGKQYRVKEKDVLKVEKLDQKVGDTVKLEALLISDSEAKEFDLGKPSLGDKVEAKVLEQAKDKKVLVTKYKNKTRYLRNVGHRQLFTKLEIVKIG